MRTIRRVAVYCGSSLGHDPKYGLAAEAVGRGLAARGIGVVYGGGHVGLMGRVADAALAGGGEVIGVITHALERLELAHHGLTRLEVVETMHARKLRMSDLADAFVALPGGFGTLDELFEALTWTQLGIQDKPAGLLDVDGFWEPMVAMVGQMHHAGFVHGEDRRMLAVAPDIDALVDALAATGPSVPVSLRLRKA